MDLYSRKKYKMGKALKAEGTNCERAKNIKNKKYASHL